MNWTNIVTWARNNSARVFTLAIAFVIPVVLWTVIAWHTTESWAQFVTCIALVIMGGGITGPLAIQWIARRPISKLGIAIAITLLLVMPLMVINWPKPKPGDSGTTPPVVSANDIKLAFLHSPRGPVSNGWGKVPSTVSPFMYNEGNLRQRDLPTGAPLAYAASYQVKWLNVSGNPDHRMYVLGQPFGYEHSLGQGDNISSVDPANTHLYLKGGSSRIPHQAWQFRIEVIDPGQKDEPGDNKVRLRRWQVYLADPLRDSTVNFGPLPLQLRNVPLSWLCTVEVQPGLKPIWDASATATSEEILGWDASAAKTSKEITALFQDHPLRIKYGSDPTDRKAPPTNIFEITSDDVAAQGELSITIPAEVGSGVVFVSLKIGLEQ